MISEDSPLRKLPEDLSRKRILVFDGIRYAADMTDIGYGRLFAHLQVIARKPQNEVTTGDLASAMLDAWSIVDAVNRFRDLVRCAPGVRSKPWKRLLRDRTADAADLRHCVQHQSGEVDKLAAEGGQIWGWLSWAEVQGRQYTGNWFMMSPGVVYDGYPFLFGGPKVARGAPFGRIRLNAFGREVYLGKLILAVRDAVQALTEELAEGTVRLVGQPAVGRCGSDEVFVEGMEVAFKGKSAPL